MMPVPQSKWLRDPSHQARGRLELRPRLCWRLFRAQISGNAGCPHARRITAQLVLLPHEIVLASSAPMSRAWLCLRSNQYYTTKTLNTWLSSFLVF